MILIFSFLLVGPASAAGTCTAPRFGAPLRLYSTAAPDGRIADFLTVDLTRTGRKDLVLLDSSDDSLVVVPVGDAGPGKPFVVRPGGLLLRTGDFNGDGRIEVVIATSPAMVERIVDRAAVTVGSFVASTGGRMTAGGWSARPGLVSVRPGMAELMPNLCGVDRPALVLPPLVSLEGAQGDRFESQLTLVNLGTDPMKLEVAYDATLGSGSGRGSFTLPRGQSTFLSAFDFLRSLDIQVPSGQAVAGAVIIRTTSSGPDVAAVVRTTVSAPGGPGKGGVAASAAPVTQAVRGGAWIPWLQEDGESRSNAAFVHAGGAADGDLTLRLTVVAAEPPVGFAGSIDLTLHPGELQQVNRVLSVAAPGVTRGALRIETVSGSAPYAAWGVVNDNGSGDGSSIPAIADSDRALWKGALVVPSIVETERYSTERFVTNLARIPRTLTATFRSELVSTPTGTVTFPLAVPPLGVVAVPDLIQALRNAGVAGFPPRGQALAAALFLSADDGDTASLLAGARVTTTVQGNRFGVYLPAVPRSATADEAWLFGLRQDDEVRTNLAIVNTGDSQLVAIINLFDAATGWAVSPALPALVIDPGRRVQLDQVLRKASVPLSAAYARIRGPGRAFLAYAIVNDGADPDHGTGDGSYVAMQSW